MRSLTHGLSLRKPLLWALLALIAAHLLTPTGIARTHTVQRGETLSTIATQYGIDADTLARANQLGDADLVIIGQKLSVPADAAPFIEYKVRKGDSLGSIATRFGVSPQEISKANNLRDDDLVYTGEQLRIPNKASLHIAYTVRKGDSLASIAASQDVSVQSITDANGLRNANLLQVGQVLAIPGSEGNPPEPAATRSTAPARNTPAVTYIVRKGDILAEIAADQGIPASMIAEANKLSNANLLKVGQVLVIPEVDGAVTAPDVSETQSPEATSTPDPAAAQQVVINGIIGAGELEMESVRLLNIGNEVSMAGWTLDDGDGHLFNFPDFTFYSTGAVDVHSRAGTNTTIDLYWGLDQAIWMPGKVIYLRNVSGDLISSLKIPAN